MMNRLRKKRRRILLLLSCALFCFSFLSGCVDQSAGDSKRSMEDTAKTSETTQRINAMLEITDPEEKAAVETAKAKVESMEGEPRIIATSVATAEICEQLELDLAGVCSSTISSIPKRYSEVEQVGTAMAPDMELIASLSPDWILSPASLQSDLQPKYEAINTDWAFLNLRSVQGMYRSIQELGEIFGREEQAWKLVEEFVVYYQEYITRNEGNKSPDVLVLMGLPGSYIIATENSYVGSLVELAGGKNVYAGTNQEFLTVNTEDMKTKEPDIILCAAHALPDQVTEMFQEDFKTNDIWQHFDAVKNDKVYYLSYELFGMSANFRYPEALEELQSFLYPSGETEEQQAKKNSENAMKAAKESQASEKIDKDMLRKAGT